jgi:MFS family permease
MPEPHPDSPLRAPAHGADLSPLAPFRLPVFRMLWITWLMANISMWMNDVAAAWMMTSLTATPIWVALVQTASTLPVFLLGLPSGALADILDRKRYFLVTQLWVAVVALLLSAVIFFGAVSPPLLLALTFANGVGLAMRWPVFAAIVPELVPRPQLPAALALNGVSMNASRIIGPLVAGALIASAGSAWVFLLNATLSDGRGRHHPALEARAHAAPAGARGPAQCDARGAAVRAPVQPSAGRAAAHLAVLPAFHRAAGAAAAGGARRCKGGGAGTFTLLLASMGAGAIVATAFLPQLRRTLRARRAGDARLAAAIRRHGGGGLRARRLGGRAGHVCRRHGLDHHRQHAQRVGPDGPAGLGARARHVDVPDGDHGRQRAGRRACGGRSPRSAACRSACAWPRPPAR